VCVCVCVCVCVRVCVYVCVCVCVCVRTCVCMCEDATCVKRDLQKRPTKDIYNKNPKRDHQKSLWVFFHTCVRRDLQKRPTKETYKRDLQKRSSKESVGLFPPMWSLAKYFFHVIRSVDIVVMIPHIRAFSMSLFSYLVLDLGVFIYVCLPHV